MATTNRKRNDETRVTITLQLPSSVVAILRRKAALAEVAVGAIASQTLHKALHVAELERLEREEASLLQQLADETDVEALGAAVDEDGNDDGRQVDTAFVQRIHVELKTVRGQLAELQA